MEYVYIQLPADLYNSIYLRYQADTTNIICQYLTQLLDGEPEPAVPKTIDSSRLQYPRPRSGTKTGRVWEIADGILKETGRAGRVTVIKACMSEGININTASTQYSYWHKATPQAREG
jgi:hypothetical protein